MFRVAVSGRREPEPSFFTVVVWRDQAEHAAQSLAKSSRVVVVGRLQQRTGTTEDGSARSTVEVVAEELGPSLAVGDGDHDQDDAEPGVVVRLVGSFVVLSARQARVPAKLGWSAHRHHAPATASQDAAVSLVGGAEASSRPETTQRSPCSGTAPRMTAA